MTVWANRAFSSPLVGSGIRVFWRDFPVRTEIKAIIISGGLIFTHHSALEIIRRKKWRKKRTG
jgi:hypothetical protein